LDLCAGLGTKSIQLARAFPLAKITAADIDSVKLGRLANRATQIGVQNIATIAAPALFKGSSSRFDIVLVDVPCSNTGVMAKRVQSRWRWPSLDHGALHELQYTLLAQGASLLAAGGTLIYSTCSIDPAENQQQIKKLLASPEISLQLRHEQATLPSLAPALESTHDGGYFAILC
jgi:16S rRNA (cytosine967-C5)-methyltransferase